MLAIMTCVLLELVRMPPMSSAHYHRASNHAALIGCHHAEYHDIVKSMKNLDLCFCVNSAGPVRPKWDYRGLGLNQLPEHVQPSFWDALAMTQLVGAAVATVA
jgi:hypothetical protein